jgi:hypothetical protein
MFQLLPWFVCSRSLLLSDDTEVLRFIFILPTSSIIFLMTKSLSFKLEKRNDEEHLVETRIDRSAAAFLASTFSTKVTILKGITNVTKLSTCVGKVDFNTNVERQNLIIYPAIKAHKILREVERTPNVMFVVRGP